MATINDFEDLQVWQLAREQCKEVSCYLFKLRSQFWRALDLDLISQENFSNFIEKNRIIGRKINSFILYLKNSEIKGIKFKKRNES
jgi:hypothetical protein